MTDGMRPDTVSREVSTDCLTESHSRCWRAASGLSWSRTGSGMCRARVRALSIVLARIACKSVSICSSVRVSVRAPAEVARVSDAWEGAALSADVGSTPGRISRAGSPLADSWEGRGGEATVDIKEVEKITATTTAVTPAPTPTSPHPRPAPCFAEADRQRGHSGSPGS